MSYPTAASTGWLEATRKRDREDEHGDIAIGGTLGFTEHRSKRLQTLPLRVSPTSKRRSVPPDFPPLQPHNSLPARPDTLTPSDSDSEDRNQTSYCQDAQHDQPSLQDGMWPAPELSAEEQRLTFSMEPELLGGDMDMMDTSEPELTLPRNPAQDHLQPGPSQPDPVSSTITGRVPTPIHCSFAAQVKGNSWGGAAGSNAAQADRLMQPSLPEGIPARVHELLSSQEEQYHGAGMLGHESVPRSFDGPTATAAVMADWSQVQNRRLPSPISEAGAEDGSETLDSPPGMVLDSSMGHMNRHGHQHPLLSSLPPRATSALEMVSRQSTDVAPQFGAPNADSGNSPESPNESAMEVDPSAGSSPKKGHTRSRHTLNSWTLQPGMKKSFSIGYRADCEKCRMKVPGHFNHIIVS